MNKAYIFLIIFSTLSIHLIGQGGWKKQRLIPNGFANQVADICTTSDSGIVVTGSGGNGAFLYKLSPNGDSLWYKEYSFCFQSMSVKATHDNGLVICGTNSLGNNFFVLKTNSIGDSLWVYQIDFGGDNKAFEIQETTDNGFIIAGLSDAVNGSTSLGSKAALLKLDQFGNREWSREYFRFSWTDLNDFRYVEQTSDGGYIATGAGEDSGENIWVVKTDSVGNVEWQNIYNGDFGTCVRELDSGNFAVWGGESNRFYLLSPTGAILQSRIIPGASFTVNYANYPTQMKKGFISDLTSDNGFISITKPFGSGSLNKITLSKQDSLGNTIWTQEIEAVNANLFPVKVIEANPEYYYILCSKYSSPSLYAQVIKIDTSGRIYRGALGRVFQDYNQDCIEDPQESGLAYRNLIVTPGNIIIQSDNTGLWNINSLAPGTYNISVDTSNLNWQNNCPPTQSFSIIHPDSLVVGPDFGLINTNACPQPKISIHAPFLRPGFSNQKVYIQACNDILGTAIMDSVYTIVTLDSLLTVTGSSLPYTPLGNNQYQVDLANTIFPGQCIDFWFECTLSTDAILGESLCLQAELYPIDSCALDSIPAPFPIGTVSPCNTPWDKSSLEVNGECLGDTIQFTILNTGDPGDGDMSCFAPIRLYIDGQFIIMDSIQLNGGDSIVFLFAGDGRTWRLEADQHPLHPGNSNPNASVERCGDPQNWSPGLVGAMPQDDLDPVRDIYCGIVTGSYDPNDKTGYPLGIDSSHYIQRNQDLEYRIRFQNTGTDTAFTVIIRDTLPEELNIFTVESGVSSHPYSFRMYGPRVLEWRFDNILLPDSTTNEPESNGFVYFKVQQNPDLPYGTKIENNAGIYFDFNPPIITNVYHHTVHDFPFQYWDGRDTTNVAVCDSFSFRGNTYTQAGQYLVGESNNGIDSLFTLNLTTLRFDSTIVATGCDSFYFDSQILDSTGVYIYSSKNAAGCDSIVTLDLTVNPSSSFHLVTTSCDSLVIENQVYLQSGNYTQILRNQYGCDSTLSIDLTIHRSTDATITETSCDSFSLNGQTYFNSGNYQQNFTNAAGCDSTLHINLTIEESSDIDATVSWDGLDLQVAQTGASYQWLDCNNGLSPIAGATTQSFSPQANGSYAVEITSGNCTTISSCYDITNVSINNNQTASDIRLYPNPTKNQITIDFGAWQEEVNIRLLGLDGRLIKEINSSASNQAQMELGELPQGLYLLEVQLTGQAPQTLKISKY